MGLNVALYHNLPPGGARRVVFESVSRLARHHRVDLFCPATALGGFWDVADRVHATRVFPVRPSRTLRSPFGRLSALLRLAELGRLERLGRLAAASIDRQGYDVVLVHPCMVAQGPAVLAYLRTPSVYYAHEILRTLYEPGIPRPYRSDAGYRGALNRIDPLLRCHRLVAAHLDRRNIRAAGTVLTNSQYTRDAVRSTYGVEARVNRPGVDLDTFRPLGQPREYRVISVSAVKPEKGLDFLIWSLATLVPGERPPLLVVANDEVPGERSYLQRLADRLAVRVEFRLRISEAELVRAYNGALFTIYAPVGEPLGLVALESQACATPVVGVAEAGVLETVVHQSTGLLAPRQAEEFGEAMRALLTSRERIERYGARGRAHVEERWNWAASVRQLEQELLAAAQRPDRRHSNDFGGQRRATAAGSIGRMAGRQDF